MTASGYTLQDEALVTIDVTVHKFIHQFHHYAVIFGQLLTADIELDVAVIVDGKTLLRKTFAETVERRPPISNLYKEEEMFSECLSKIVDEVISDHNVISAIKKGHESAQLGEVCSGVPGI